MADQINTGNGSEPAEYTSGSLDIDDNQSVSFYSSQAQQYPVENLEVHDPNAVKHSNTILHPLGNSFKFSRRRAMVVSLIITMIIIILTGVAMLFLVKYSSKSENNSKLPQQQDLTLKDGQDSVIPKELQGAQQSLLVNGDIVTRGNFKVSNGTSVSVLRLQDGATGNQTITLPNGSGTICLDSNNCGYTNQTDFNGLQGQVNSLQAIISALSQMQVPAAGVDSLNSQKGTVSIQGSLNQIAVNTSNGVLTLSTPQDLDANANVQFGSLAISQTGQILANKLVQTGAGNSINIDAGNDFITFTAGGRIFQLPNSGGVNQTICTTGASCASGGGTAVLLASGSVQNESDPAASIFINDTGGGNLLQLQTGGVDKLVVANNGNTTVGGSLTVSSLGNGFVKSTAGALSVVSNINLSSSDVTGTLAVSNGGTGLNTIPANGVLVGNGTSPVSSVVAGAAGLCLMSNAGAPSFQACPGSGGVTSLNGQTGALTVVGTTNQVNVNTAAGTITLSTPQNIHVAATPTFAGLTLSGLGTGPVKASAGLLGTGNINLGSEVTGLLGVTLGGTGVSTTPSNGQLLIGNGTGYTLATLTAGSGVNITNGSGTITIAAPSAGSCATCANQALSNLSGVALNTSLLTGSTTIDLGSNAAPFRDLYLGGSATNNFKFTGVATAARTLTVPDASGTLAISASGNIALSALGNISLTGQIPVANGGTGSATAAGARTNLGAAASGANTDITSLAPAGTLTVGSTGQILTLQGNASTSISATNGANSTTVSFAAPSGTNTITFPALTGTVCVSTGNCATAGSAGGDLTGTYPNPTIAKLQGTTLNISGPTGGQVLIYNGTNGRWENHGVSGDITLSETGTATIANNAVTSAKIADGTITGTDIASSTVTNGNLVNSSLTVTAGTGLTGGGLVSLGSSTAAINVVYGSTAGSAVQGNVQITCASGTGNLTGGGNAITLGTGGTCNNISIVSNPTFTGPLTVGASGTQGSFVLYDGGAGVAANTGTIQVISSLGQNTTYTLPDPGAGTATICLSTGNCAGAGGGITGTGTTGKIAKFTSSGTVGDSILSESSSTITLNGNMVIQGSSSLALGTSSSLDGSVKFYNAAGTHFVALQAPATDPATDLTFKLPNSYGANGDCLQSNGTGGLSFTSCTGGAGGGVTSINSQTGVVSLANATAATGTITINDASTAQKGIAQFNSTNFSAAAGVINTVQNIDNTAAPTFAGLKLTGLGAGAVVSDVSGNLSSTQLNRNSSTYFSGALSAVNGGTGQTGYAVGDLLYADTTTTLNKLAAVASGQCLVSNGVGVAPSWSVCPGSGGVSSVNTFTGAVTIQGTTNQVIVSNSTGTVTLSTPQDINTTSAPQFSGLGLTGSLTFTGVATDITTGANQDLTLDANGTGKTILSDAVDVAGLLSANGGIQTNGAAIATSNGALTLGSGNITTTGTITAGLINGQTISSSANFTGSVTIQGSSSLTLGTSSSLDGSIAFRNAAGTHTVSLQAPTTDPTANFTLKLPSAGPASAGDCLLSDASGNLYFATCPGSGGGGVTSLDSLSGALTIANTSGSGATITIDDATTLAKGIASYNSGNFSVTSGAVSIKTGGVGSAEIADGSVTGTDIASNTVANGNLVNSSVTVNAGTNLSGGGAVSLGSNITLNVASSPTFSGNVTVQGGTTTLGQSGQQGSAVLYNGGIGVAAHTGTVQVIGSLGQDTTYTLPDPGAASATICLSTGNCAAAGGGITGSGTNGQVAYFNGSGTITSSANLLFNGTDVTVAGALSGNTLVSTVATGTAPLTVASTTLVTNFNADLLDGQHGAFYQDAGNLNAGVIASARVSGSYTGITGLGTISIGTWQADAIADAYLQDNITISALGTVDWAALNNYPAACAAGSAVTQLGDSITCAAFASGSGSGNYIQNNTGPVQAGASFWIDGTGRADTKLQTPLLDTATAVALNLGTTNATQINLNKNVVVAANQSLTLTGGTTASRPASPSEGMMFYDTSTKQLLTYSNGKWQASRASATKIVAASNSSQAAKDAADYVATGTDDATTINSAISALPAGGGVIYLSEGTYTMGTTSVSLPNNTTLAGSGTSTLLTYANNIGSGTYYMIRNSDTATGTHVAVRDLMIDGNKAGNTAPPTTTGIFFQGMGSSTADGGKITNVTIKNMNTYGIQALNSQNSTFIGNTLVSNKTYGISLKTSNYNTVTGNIVQSNGNYGIYIEAASYNTISGNTSSGNTTAGIMLYNSAISNTVTGNTVQGSLYGIQIFISSTFNVVSGNNIIGSGNNGIYLNTSADNNVISGNKIHDSGGSTSNNGIYINTSDGNTITGNNISDVSATGTNLAITINDSGSSNTTLANNVLGTGSIGNAGTNTIFNSQVNGSGVIVLQDTSGINLNSATTIAANLTVSNAGNVAFQKGTDYATVGTTNNVNFGNGALFRLTGVSAQTITGIANGADGRMITLINAASQTATISNNSASSTAANRIITGTGADMTLAAGASISMVYDSGASFWRVVGSTSAVGGGTYVNLQASTPGTADTGNFNITGTGIAATLQGTTSVLTPSVDVVSAGALSVGTSTATAITIGKAGITTTNAGALTVTQAATFNGAATFNNSVTVSSGQTLTVAGGATSLTGGTSGDAVTISNNTSTGNIAVFKDNTTAIATFADGGAVTFQNSVDSSAAFSINKSTGANIVTVNTSTSSVGINVTSPQAPLHVGVDAGGLFSDGFEDGTLPPFSSVTASPWTIVSSGANSGTYAAMSGATTSGSSDLTITKTLTSAGNISFARSVSSESGFDFLRFYIDGVEQANWSGVSGWGTVNYAVAVGTHTFKWAYTKDSSGNFNADRAWIDDVQITNVAGTALSAIFNGNVGIGTTSPSNALEVNGTILATTVQAATFDTGSATALNIGTTNATQINLNKNVVVAANQTLTITGQAGFPGSPTEGMMFYNTTSKQLFIYANGQWQADRSSNTKIVGTNVNGGVSGATASQNWYAADYINSSATSAQTTINAAISAVTASTGGTVYLMEGTYIIDGSISIPNNVRLIGSGPGTIIKAKNGINANFAAIVNTDTTTGTNITIQDLTLEGNKANQSGAVSMAGILLNGMGSSSRAGATIANVQANNWYFNTLTFPCYDGDGICLTSSSSNNLTNIKAQGNGGFGIRLAGSNTNNVITNSVVQSNNSGISLTSSNNNTITGSSIQSNTSTGVLVSNANNNTITANNVQSNTFYGVYVTSGSSNTITGNNIQSNGTYGITLQSSSNTNTVSANNLSNNGGSTTNNAIYLTASDSNSITNNVITDSSATTNNYAINLFDSTSDTNYVSSNTLGGGSVNDAGTGTVYGGQVNSSTNYVIQPAGTIELMKSTNVTGNLAVTGTGSFTGGSVTVATATATDDRLVVSVATGGAARFDGTITNADLTAARTWTLPDESGTICIVGSTSCLSGAGFVQFAPASVQADTSTNTSIFINKTGASGNIIDLQKSGVDLFIVNSTGAIQLGSTGNGITLAGSGGVTTGSFTLNGTARNTKTITLNAEYAGAVLDAASDSSCSAANNGTLTSGFTTSGTNTKPEGYYTWSSTQASAQCYDVVVQVPLPSDFDGFTGTQSVNVWSSNTTNGTVVMDKNVNGTTDGSAYGTTLTPSSASTWTNQTFTFASSYTSSNANQMLTLRIRMSSLSSAQVNLGRITLQYYSKF